MPSALRAAILLVAICCALVAPAAAQTVESIKVERQVRGKSLTLPVEIHWPSSTAAKLPAIIVVHGSGGARDNREGAYARAFNGMGIAGIVIDSFTPRGVHTTVNDQSTVRDLDMLADAGAVLKVIAGHPKIDSTRIGLIGFSKGGTVAVKAALRRNKTGESGSDPHFSVLIALYPWCGDMPLDFTPAGAPLVMLMGGDDTYVGTTACREYAKKFEAAGGKLTMQIYPGAKHDWDIPGAASWTMRHGQNSSRCIYDEVQPGRWVERSSGLPIFVNGAPAPEAKKARSHCRTIGVSGGYDAATAKKSMREIAVAIRVAFRLD